MCYTKLMTKGLNFTDSVCIFMSYDELDLSCFSHPIKAFIGDISASVSAVLTPLCKTGWCRKSFLAFNATLNM